MKAETEEKGNKVQMEQIENTTQINERFKPKCYIHNTFLLLHGNHKCGSLKRHTFPISPLLWVGGQAHLAWVLCWGSLSCIKLSPGQGSHLEAGMGRGAPPLTLFFAAFSSFQLRLKASRFFFVFSTCWPEAALWSYSASALPYHTGIPRGGDSSKVATEISHGAST